MRVIARQAPGGSYRFAFHFPLSTFADSSVWNAVEAGHITWSNATTNWVGGDLVITYKTFIKNTQLEGGHE